MVLLIPVAQTIVQQVVSHTCASKQNKYFANFKWSQRQIAGLCAVARGNILSGIRPGVSCSNTTGLSQKNRCYVKTK